ncbi:MAG: signal peptide peptidase SppA, partial [Myxococcota bacterium]
EMIVSVALGVGAFVLVLGGLLGVLAFGVWMLRRRARKRLPKSMVLELELADGISETEASDPLSKVLGRGALPLRSVLEALERAREDKRVKALVLNCSGASMGLAQAEEIRAALVAFRAAGKEVVAFADTFGEGAPGWVSYYLASAADRIVLQPSGDLNLTGLSAEQPFVRELLERLGVTPRFQQRYEYKSIVEMFSREDMSSEAKEALRWIFGDILDVLTHAIVESRTLSDEAALALVEEGPHSGARALELGLVDALAYRDEAYEALKETHGEKAKLRYLSHYLQRSRSKYEKGPVIAVVTGDGDIVRGPSSFNPRSRSSSMGSETVSAALRSAASSDEVKAIVFRVNTRGGSYVASDTIWREVVRARESGTPVVAWMGDYAASGGYFVSAPANKVVASAMTLTGSIGVAGGKFVLEGLWPKLGVRFDGIATHDNAKYFSANHDYDESGEKAATDGFDRAYEDFTGKVGSGRALDPETVDGLARGRVWTGRQAMERGLVDEVGGFEVALACAKREAEIEGPVSLTDFPRPKELWEQALGGTAKNSEEQGSTASLGAVLDGVLWWLSLPWTLRELRREGIRTEMPRVFGSSGDFWRQ